MAYNLQNTYYRTYSLSEVGQKILSMPLDKASEKFLKRLGLRLREIRQEKGWTLEQVEEKGWPNWRHLQKIEAGKNVTIASLIRLAKVYGVSVKELIPEHE